MESAHGAIVGAVRRRARSALRRAGAGAAGLRVLADEGAEVLAELAHLFAHIAARIEGKALRAGGVEQLHAREAQARELRQLGALPQDMAAAMDQVRPGLVGWLASINAFIRWQEEKGELMPLPSTFYHYMVNIPVR